MAEPGGEGSDDVALPRIGPRGDGGDPPPEPAWEPAPPEAFAAMEAIARPDALPPLDPPAPAEPPDELADLGVGEVFVVGSDGTPVRASDQPEEPAGVPGGPAPWVLAVGVLVALVVAAAVLVVVQRDDEPAPRYAFPDGVLIREQTAPEETPRRQWEMDVPCGAYDTTALEGQFTATPGCELGADDGQVYLLRRAQGENATLTAFEADTGRQRWQAELDQDPDLVSAFAGLVFVTRYGFGRDRITAFDRDSGAQQWSASGGGLPLGVDRTLLVSRSRDGVPQVAAISLDDGDDRWTRDLELVGLCDGTVYGTVDDQVVAVDPVSGEERWRVDLEPWRTVQCAGDQVVALHDSRVRSLDPADGSDRWEVDLGVVRSLSVLPGATIATTATSLVALEPEDGAERWSVDGERFEEVHGYEGIDRETALGTDNVWAYVVELSTGRLVGRKPLGRGLQLAVPQGLAVTIDRGAVDAFGVGDLEPVWDLTVPTATRRIVLGGDRLYALGAATLTAYA